MTNSASPEQAWFLETVSGPLAGQKTYLRPRAAVACGRRADAGSSHPHDAHMSGLHFVAECDGSGCKLKDLNSRNGTFVNGARVREAALACNDLITAGETTFIVGLESTGKSVAKTHTGARGPQNLLLSLLSSNFQPLFAILDAARDHGVLALLLQSQAQYQSLYEGPRGESLSDIAPYLVRLPADAGLLSTLINQGWGQSWGVYLKSPCEFQALRHHLRQFLQVRHASGEQLYFRFYDPRVLRLYLPSLVAAEADSFCGPISCYLVEDEDPGRLLQFVNTGQGIGKSVISLALPLQHGNQAEALEAKGDR